MKPPRWITSEHARLEAQAYNDKYDREVLGIEPLGRRWSEVSREERRAYQARRDEAMRKLRGSNGRYKGHTSTARERQREASKRRAGEEMEVSDANRN
jgi:hypothetical protein